MKQVLTVGLTVLAGVALVEVALVPAVVLGGALVLGPKLFPRSLPTSLFRPRRRPRPAAPALDRRVSVAPRGIDAPMGVAPRFLVKQAILKTITFRLIVTTLDFSTNYIVLGEFATAAGLSGFALVVGPFFYFLHETLWTRLGPIEEALEIPVALRIGAEGHAVKPGGFVVSRAIVKTITFRTIATTMDFTANYVVVGDLATAIGLSAVGFVLGPFVYLGHEMAWDRYGRPGARLEARRGSASHEEPGPERFMVRNGASRHATTPDAS